jgi:hypothetical protein
VASSPTRPLRADEDGLGAYAYRLGDGPVDARGVAELLADAVADGDGDDEVAGPCHVRPNTDLLELAATLP